jgi:hypothetical protein
MRTIVIGLFFESIFYLNSSLQDVIQLINIQFPNNYLIFDYNIFSTITELDEKLNSFIERFPSEIEKVTISNLSIALKYISDFFYNLNLNVPCFSLDATALFISQLKNVFSFAYSDQYSVMSQFLLYKDYQCKNMIVLFDDNNDLFKLFIQSYIQTLQNQANLLNIPIQIYSLKDKYKIKCYTQIIILCDNQLLIDHYINDEFLKNIPKHCFITLTDLNDNISDIFKNIPAFPLIPTNLNYTQTSQLIYESIQNKNKYSYGIYAFYDICFILNYLTTNFISEPLTIQLFISTNAFQEILPSWLNGLIYNTNKNTFSFGTYNCIFTKNVLFTSNEENVLYLNCNQGGFKNLPESNSLLKKIGIIPWFSTQILYDNCQLYHVYKNCKLSIVRFSLNITEINNEFYNIDGAYSLSFIVNFNNEGYFTILRKIYDKINPIINSNMSKTPILKYLCK